ncbi:MAG: hypothetical protein K9N51_10105 [Candidatus Pacebacteria bacterium]|nr:hypothetical protein [Candidatus Paceibacterota bacterium]
MKSCNARTVVHRAFAILLFTCMAGHIRATEIRLEPQAHAREPRDFNFRYGDIYLDLTGGISMRYSDNINYAASEDNEVDSWYVTPRLTLSAYWPVSPYVDIDSAVSVGYVYYLNDEAEDNWYVSGTEGNVSAGVSSQIRLGDDHIITLRDELAREVDSLDIAVRGRPEDYAITRNTFSAVYSRALTPSTTGSLQYAHENVWVNKDEFDWQNSVSDSIDGLVLWHAMRNFRIGPYARVEWYRFPEDVRNDRVSYEAGLTSVGSFTVGTMVTYTANVGYEAIALDDSNAPDVDDDEGGFVADFTAAVNPTIFPGHRVRCSYRRNHETVNPFANYADELLLGYGIDFYVTRNLLATADVDYLHIWESDDGENAELWRFWMRTSYALTPKTSVGAGYRYTFKDSDDADREYNQGTFEVTITTTF